MKKKVKLNGKDFELKFTFRADMIFENIYEKSFTGKTETEWIIYMYSTYLALADDTEVSLEEFVKWLDENPNSLLDFIAWYSKTQENNLKLMGAKIGEDEEGKKA